MMRLSLVSGSWPPDRCGVGDYSDQLAQALRSRQATVQCLGGEPWSGRGALFEVRAVTRQRHVDVVHLQYPTMGFGRSVVPTLLPLLPRDVPFVVTMHEFSSFRRARRPWFASFAHRVDLRIFTSDEERDRFKRVMKPTSGDDVTIPIGSNIAIGRAQRRRSKSVCYFGLISPGKGLEAFLELAAAKKDTDWHFSLIGAEPPMYAAYAHEMIASARALGVSLCLNRQEAEVADLLATQEVAYLPFPHGATITRGSLLAAMRNGAVVVTSHADVTSDSLKRTTVHATGAAEAAEKIGTLFANRTDREALRVAAAAVPSGWDQIADAHLSAYASAIAKRRVRTGARWSLARRPERVGNLTDA